MTTEPVIESGLQLITRLIDRPSVENLDDDIFFKKLENTDVIEIKGTISSGITILLTRLIAKCILPMKYNGLGMNVLLINTDFQFQVPQLFNVIRTEICDVQGPIKVDELVKGILSNLKIFNCYNHQEFFLTLNSLDNILLKNKEIGLIVIDSISAYYWQQQESLAYNAYLMKMLNIVKKVTTDFRVVTLYTKQFNFESKKQTSEWHESKKILRYEISLCCDENTNELTCSIKSGKDKKHMYYEIHETGLKWIEKKVIIC